MKRTLRERLLSRAIINPETGCWEWAGSRDKRGYGRINVSGTPQLAHRIAFEMWRGPLPPHREGNLIRELDHLCEVHCCLNPAHLELVTHHVNMQRADMSPAGLVNRLKTNCPKGHPYDEKNTYISRRGSRSCRACINERDRAVRAARGAVLPPGARTHCPQGHPYDKENTYVAPGSSKRQCRTCIRDRARKKAAGISGPT